MFEEKNEIGRVGMPRKQKIIISVLSVIFLVVLIGAFWDLYGRNLLCNCDCSQQESSEAANDSASSTTAVPDSQATSKSSQKGGKQDRENKTTASTSANAISSASYDSCINQTKDNPECKNCCDCLSGAGSETRTACRNTCATHDFGTNSNFITVSAPSALGEKGDYSTCTGQASSGECKNCCENSMGLQCGDYRHCRTACNTKFGTTSGPQQ